MKRQLLSSLLAVVLLMTGCSGGSNPAVTKEAETAQDITQEEEAAAPETTQMSAQAEDQTPAEETDSQQTAKGIRGMSASEFEPIESENGNIVILYTNDVHCAVEKGIG